MFGKSWYRRLDQGCLVHNCSLTAKYTKNEICFEKYLIFLLLSNISRAIFKFVMNRVVIAIWFRYFAGSLLI